MENNFRSAAFGGFNRQDVMTYISKVALENGDRIAALEKEKSDLEAEVSRMEAQTQEIEDLRRQTAALEQRLAEERSAKELYRAQAEEYAARMERMADLEQEVAAYSDVKEHIADIELEARRRADSMIAVAKSQADRIVGDGNAQVEELRQAVGVQVQEIAAQYQETMRAFDTASNYMAGELRKIDVAMGQMPLAFNRVRGELDKLLDQI